MCKYRLDYYTNTLIQKGISKLIPSYYLNKAYNNYNKINLTIDRSRIALLFFDCDKNTDIEVMERLLTILSDNHIIANFAIPACYIKDYLSLMKNAISAGHELLNHSFSYPNNKDFELLISDGSIMTFKNFVIYSIILLKCIIDIHFPQY